MVQLARQPGGRFKVLLANEQEGWHQTVRRLLEPQGVQTLSARSGREALELIESTPVHVAVLDAQMPQLGGMQVIRLMREMHRPEPGGAAGGADRGARDAGRVEVPTAI